MTLKFFPCLDSIIYIVSMVKFYISFRFISKKFGNLNFLENYIFPISFIFTTIILVDFLHFYTHANKYLFYLKTFIELIQ